MEKQLIIRWSKNSIDSRNAPSPLPPRASRLTPVLLLAMLAVHSTVQAVTLVPKDIVPERIPGAKPRNVEFILSDDHRYDAMSGQSLNLRPGNRQGHHE